MNTKKTDSIAFVFLALVATLLLVSTTIAQATLQNIPSNQEPSIDPNTIQNTQNNQDPGTDTNTINLPPTVIKLTQIEGGAPNAIPETQYQDPGTPPIPNPAPRDITQDEIPEPTSAYKAKLTISPEKQQSNSGSATYKITLIDEREDKSLIRLKYSLEFFSEQQIEGSLRKNEISLLPGESETISLNVEAENKGSYVFIVRAQNNGFETNTKGLFVLNGQTPQTSEESLFSGRGFILDITREKGEMIGLDLVENDGEVKGVFNVQTKEQYKFTGTKKANNLDITIISKNGERVGNLQAEIKEFESFLLLQGALTLESEAYTITATSEKKKTFTAVNRIDINTRKAIIKETKIDEVATIVIDSFTDQNTQEEIYIHPIEIQKEKFLGIIPNPFTEKKVLKVEIIQNGKTIERILKPFKKQTFGQDSKYQIELKNFLLEDDTTVEFSVTRLEN